MKEIPDHLKVFVVEQDPSLYTAIDHASWRYILRVSKAYFARHAHQKYLDGLQETGISTERIPLISEMDECLRRFGWRAVAVSGFIPPSAFMEFQSLGVLPIACDMRTLEHLAYTPAPDIVHEAAGHAPIVADPAYATYLRSYGEISRKALFSYQDMDVYLAIRNLSVIKEDPASSPTDIAKAQKRLDDATAAVSFVSEAAFMGRMNWWTVEYGLVGDMKNPKIYGAGLLSSVGESFHCLGSEVKKIPFSLDCIQTSYDITRPQPQLFVTPNFDALERVLEEFAATMAFRRGGKEGLEKARQARTVSTTQLDSGIQISGLLSDFLTEASGQPCYLKYQGPAQLAYRDQEIRNQGADYHKEGFGTPVGALQGGKSPADLSLEELKSGQGVTQSVTKLKFASGVEVSGVFKSAVRENGKNLILTFENCTVSRGSEILFRPEWGVFDMACGIKIPSVFGGPADRARYLATTGGFNQKAGTQKSNFRDQDRELIDLYAQVRRIRESGQAARDQNQQDLKKIHDALEKKYRNEWLLRLELAELGVAAARTRLQEVGKSAPEKAELISRGLALL